MEEGQARRTEANDADVLVSCSISGGDVEGNQFARYKKKAVATIATQNAATPERSL